MSQSAAGKESYASPEHEERNPMSNRFTTDLEMSIAADLPSVRLVRCHITEGASEITHAEVEIASEESIDFDGAIEADATLLLTAGETLPRSLSLKLGRVRFAGIVAGQLRYRLDLYASLWL